MATASAGHDSGRYSPGYATSGNGTRSLSPQQQDQQEQRYHRRGYQACDPCRKRKVKCDLGSVDNPRPPPCVRCRRESKRCEFSATRRKRKPSEVEETVDGVLRRDKRMMMADATATAGPGSTHESSEDVSPFDAERHKWSERHSSVASSQTSPATNFNPSVAVTTGKTAATAATTSVNATAAAAAATVPKQNLYAQGYSAERTTGPRYGLEGGTPMMNRTAVELLSPAISNSHDALHLLSEAAGRTEDLNRQSLENRYASRQSASTYNSPASSLAQAGTPQRTGSGAGVGVGGPGSAASSFPRTSHSGSMSMGTGYQHGGVASGGSMGSMAGNRGHGEDASGGFQDAGFADAVKAWSRLRFVRAGWLTVEGAMDYIAYYYENLAPLSPIVVPDYSHPSAHRALLTDEPVLAVTILTTSSRHMKPKGDGSYTRSFYIHDRLWSYLRGMIERLFWGQEKFGAHGVDSSKPRAFELASASAKMNSHKGNLRSLGTVEALLLLTDWHPRNLHFPPGDDENALLDLDAQGHGHDGEHATNKTSTNTGEGRLAFHKWLEPAWRSDRMSWMLLSTAQALAFELGVFDQKSESKAANEPPAEQTRKHRLRRLILVYVTQSSGRLGIPTMLPLPQYANDIQPTSQADLKLGDSNIDRMHDCWIGISKLMYQSNQTLFASSEQTSELIRSGRYQDQINQFQPLMRDWRQNIDTINMAPAMRHILMIEYEYTRLYVNSLALQAVVDRWTTMSNEAAQTQNRQTGNSWFGVLMEIYRVNEPYIQEVVDASRRILQIVLDGLVPGDHLKHTPVRSCFRILSGMIFILKTFTLGAKEDDVRVSLDLQDRVVEALRTNVVDDVHLNHAISRLLELLTTNIRTRFLRFAPTDRGADGENSHDLSRQESPTRGRRDEPNSSNSNNTNNTWPTAQTQAQNHNHNNNGLGFMDGSGTSMADPLAGIPAQPINSSNINVSFMPPPPSVYYNYYDPHATPANGTGAGGAGGGGEGGNGDIGSPSVSMPENTGANALPDWFALPLDQFINSSTTTVDQGLGGTGPMLGEFDMLEVLLNEQHDGNQGEGVESEGLSHLL